MPSANIHLTYYIVLTDPDQVAALQALYPKGVNRAPWNIGPPAGGAAVEFAAPWRGYTESALGIAPYTWTPWSGAGTTDGPYPINVKKFTRHTGGFWGIGGTTTTYWWVGQFVYSPSVAEPPGGTGTTDANAPDLEYAPISLRRWQTGFEIPGGGPCARSAVGGGYNFTPDAARHVGGLGLALRGPNNDWVAVAPNKYRTLTATNGWDRGYVRLRKVSAGNSVPFWATVGLPTASNAVVLDINASGQLTVYNAFSAGRSVLGTIDPSLPIWTGLPTDDAWRRLDLLYEYANGQPNGYFRVFIDGALAASFAIPSASGGLGSGTSIQSIRIGESYSIGVNTMELDLDDWVSSDLPPGQDTFGSNGGGRPYVYDATATYQIGDLVRTKDSHVYKAIAISTGVEPSPQHNGAFWHRYEGRDWLNGSRILLSKPKAFGAGHSVNWIGNFRILLQNRFQAGLATVAALTSSTASALAEAEMDVDQMIDTEPSAVGAVSLLPTVNSTRGANSGQLGYNINAAGAVDTAIVEAAGGTYNSVLYPGPASASLIDVSPLQLRYIKGTSADAATLRSLLAEIELVGVFDRHDYRPTPDGGAWDATANYVLNDVVERKHVWYVAVSANAGVDPSVTLTPPKWTPIALPTFPVFMGQHNAPYRKSAYVVGALRDPSAPFIVVGGTYTGNATGQDLLFRAPVGLLFIRPLTAGAGGYLWWSTLSSGHPGFQQSMLPALCDAAEDRSFVPTPGVDTQSQRYLIRLCGSHAQINANAVVYQYIAVIDPGARYMLSDAMNHHQALTPDVDNPLIDPTFLPEWAFLFVESLDATGTNRFYAKGSGNAAQTIVNFGGGTVTSALVLALGKLTTRSALHALGNSGIFAFNLWRRADGTNDPGQAAVVNIGTYTGDGSASRTINLSPVSGKRPLFGLVFSEAATGYWRDPSHTGSNSTSSTGTDVTTGITGGGIDTLSVGSTLNTNAVVYTYFILFGGTTAGNNGWGTNGEYIPVEADDDPAAGDDPPPMALDDTAATAFNTPVTIDVLLNDAPGLTITAVSAPAHGTAVITGAQKILYTPTTGYSGTDTFTYTVSDGTATDTADVSVTIASGSGGGGGGTGGCTDAWGTLASGDLPYVPLLL